MTFLKQNLQHFASQGWLSFTEKPPCLPYWKCQQSCSCYFWAELDCAGFVVFYVFTSTKYRLFFSIVQKQPNKKLTYPILIDCWCSEQHNYVSREKQFIYILTFINKMEKLNTSNVQNTVKSGFEKNVNYYKQQIQENYMIQLNYKKTNNNRTKWWQTNKKIESTREAKVYWQCIQCRHTSVAIQKDLQSIEYK